MTMPAKRVVSAFDERVIGANAQPLGIRVPADLSGASAVLNAWLAESEQKVVTDAPCTVALISATEPSSSVIWAPAVEDIVEGDMMLLYSVTHSGGVVDHEGFFRLPVRRAVPPF